MFVGCSDMGAVAEAGFVLGPLLVIVGLWMIVGGRLPERARRAPRRMRVVRGLLVAYLGLVALVATSAISFGQRDLANILSIAVATLAVLGIIGGPILWLAVSRGSRSA